MRNKRKKHRGTVLALLIAAVVALGAVAALKIFPRVQEDVETLLYPQKFSDIVEKEAAAYNLEESLVYAVIKAESDFDPNAESAVGALGLMQMMPETFTWMQTHVAGEFDAEALYDPEINIRFGCALLRLLLDEFGNVETAVCAYNAGIGNVTTWLSNAEYSADGKTLSEIPFGETRHYLQKVMRNKEKYEALYGGMENG